jgi:hypothetical protein
MVVYQRETPSAEAYAVRATALHLPPLMPKPLDTLPDVVCLFQVCLHCLS